MLVPQVRCNLCRCHIDNNGEQLRGGVGLFLKFCTGQQPSYVVAEWPLDPEVRTHLCEQCLHAVKTLEVIGE